MKKAKETRATKMPMKSQLYRAFMAIVSMFSGFFAAVFGVFVAVKFFKSIENKKENGSHNLVIVSVEPPGLPRLINDKHDKVYKSFGLDSSGQRQGRITWLNSCMSNSSGILTINSATLTSLNQNKSRISMKANAINATINRNAAYSIELNTDNIPTFFVLIFHPFSNLFNLLKSKLIFDRAIVSTPINSAIMNITKYWNLSCVKNKAKNAIIVIILVITI